jgi:hypothetical protein
MNNSQNITQNISIPRNNTHQYKLPNLKEKINLASHNIRGLNNNIKLQQWITYCNQKNFHIIAISETKLKESSQTSLTNPIYKIFTSNYIPTSHQQREASMGTALMIHNTVQPYIHNIMSFQGTGLAIDFFFPNNKT